MASQLSSSVMDLGREAHLAAGTGRNLANATIVVAGVAALISSLISFL